MGKDKISFPRSLVEYPVEIRSEGQILPGKIIDLTIENLFLEGEKMEDSTLLEQIGGRPVLGKIHKVFSDEILNFPKP